MEINSKGHGCRSWTFKKDSSNYKLYYTRSSSIKTRIGWCGNWKTNRSSPLHPATNFSILEVSNADLLARYQIFRWPCRKRNLDTRENLEEKMSIYSGGCVFCNHPSKTMDRMFSICHFSPLSRNIFAYPLEFFIHDLFWKTCAWIGCANASPNQPNLIFLCYL